MGYASDAVVELPCHLLHYQGTLNYKEGVGILFVSRQLKIIKDGYTCCLQIYERNRGRNILYFCLYERA